MKTTSTKRKLSTLIFLFVLSMGVKAYAQTPLTLTVTIDSTSCSTCCDGTATLTASGGCPPYVYYTQPGGITVGPVQTGLCQGTYTVTVTDNCGTPVSNTFQMKVAGSTSCPNQITYSVQVIPESCINCCDGSAQIINLQGGCPGYTFLWSPGGMISSNVNSLCAGLYTVTVSDAGCCPSIIQSCNIPSGTTTNINENHSEEDLMVFPNPANTFLNIIDKKNQFQNTTIQIKNYLGQVVLSTPFTSQINISNLSSGIYFLTAQTQDFSKTIKLIKN